MKGDWVSDDSDGIAFSAGAVRRRACLCASGRERGVFRLAHVAQAQWMGAMSDLEILIEQMVLEISTQAFQLDDDRLPLFLNWLIAHSGVVRNAIQLEIAALKRADAQKQCKSALQSWLGSLPAQGLLWEYRVILDEIAWWRDLDRSRLLMIMKSEAGH